MAIGRGMKHSDEAKSRNRWQKMIKNYTTTFERWIKTLYFPTSVVYYYTYFQCTTFNWLHQFCWCWPQERDQIVAKESSMKYSIHSKTNYWLPLFYKPHFEYICNLILHNGDLKIENIWWWSFFPKQIRQGESNDVKDGDWYLTVVSYALFKINADLLRKGKNLAMLWAWSTLIYLGFTLIGLLLSLHWL